jgi:hypothetical protein
MAGHAHGKPGHDQPHETYQAVMTAAITPTMPSAGKEL